MTFFLTTTNLESINKAVVIDASFTYNLIIPTPLQTQLQKQVTQWQQDGYTLCAPTLWVYEITSTFCKMVEARQLTESHAQSSIALVYKLGVQLIPPDEAIAKKAYEWTRRLNRGAAYDSFYLALAETLGCEFWTLDKRLYNAAKQPWLHLVKITE